VKQSYLLAVLPTIRSIIQGGWLVVIALLSTTHFVSTGPGTCVPLFYIFYILKKMKMSRVRLMFFESWCRVEDLSLSGKLVRPIADNFVVHWPELA
jgi:beta-1,4-N-acetylglucosaminyltransferase